jgi:hypothetical protein
LPVSPAGIVFFSRRDLLQQVKQFDHWLLEFCRVWFLRNALAKKRNFLV